MDTKTIDLLTRLFIADVDGGGFSEDEVGYYSQTEACALVGELRKHLEDTKQWDWDTHAAPVLEREAGEGYV